MYLLDHGTIVTNDNVFRIIPDGAILVSDNGVIEAVGPKSKIRSDIPRSFDKVDLNNHLVFPGLINAHCHAYQSVIRGLGCDRPLEQWLEEVKFPFLKHATPDIIYHGTIVSLIENLRSGVTSIINNHDVLTDEKTITKVIDATKKIGLRSIVARGIREARPRDTTGFTTPEYLTKHSGVKEINFTRELINKYGNNHNNMLRIWYAPMVTNSLSSENLELVSQFAMESNSGVHIHVAETQTSQESCVKIHGIREIEFLHRHNILNKNFHCIHGVWLSNRERDLLSQGKSTIIHNPASNGILGSGVADLPAALNKRIPLAIGTDGAATNNSNNMIEALKLSVLFQRIHSCSPTLLDAKQAVRMATQGGAYAMGLENHLGSLEQGRIADIMAVKLTSPQSIPSPDPYTALVYALQASDVNFVMVNGVIRFHQNTLVDEDEQALLQHAHTSIKKLISQLPLE